MEFLFSIGFTYAVVHFMIASHHRNYEERSSYEKVLTWVLIAAMSLTFLAGFVEGVVG